MAIPILATKLFAPPPRPQLVLRPHLIEQLKKGLLSNSKLSLISAPAGFGKTTLVSEWIANCEQPVAWLSLDEEDKDPARFISYLIAALQTTHEGVGEGLLPALQSHQPPAIDSILTILINEITTIPDQFILILDDYHMIDSKPIDDALAFLLERQPPRMHLVIATREDPNVPLARLRARGQLTELRAADLRFTPAEAAEFLNRVMGLNLSAEDIAALEARTEGWIAGLQLAALSMQGREDIARFIQAFTGSHRFVLDYLVEEVLLQQPESIRNFLLQTAVLDRFCPSLCNAITEREDGKEMLDVLERNNLFLIPLDDQRQWYRYHHLFSEVLQTHLLEFQPKQVSRLHQQASMWYEQNGLRSDAIHHALAAKNFEYAAGLIELTGPRTEDGGIQQATWLGWVKALPEELIRARPVLSVWYGYSLLGSGDLESAETRFRQAERCLESADASKVQLQASSVETGSEGNQRMVVVDQEQFESLAATIAVGRAYIAQALGNLPDTVRYASQVLELMPNGDHFRREQASMLLGMTYWASGNLQAADGVFAEFTMKLRNAGNIPDAISTITVLADIRLALGHLREAIITVEQCLQFVMNQGEPIPFDTADLHRALSELALEQGNVEAAAHHLQRATELGEKAQLPVLRYRLCIAQARNNETRGDMDGALAKLDEAERMYVRSPLPDFRPIPAMKARIWIAQGKLANAQEWVREKGLSPDNDLSYLREFELITLAKMLVAQQDQVKVPIQTVMRFLDRLLQAAQEGNRIRSVIEILVLQALAHQSQGNITPALTSLERALTLAEPEGYIRIFVDESEPMRLLILDFRVQIEKRKREQDHKLIGYTDKLLAAFAQLTAGPQTTNSNEKSKIRNPPSAMVESLSEHELEVLRLLRTELSGPEIARDRMVSLSTIRTHTQHIYAKLGVNNRRAAVRRAEELGLF